MRNEVLNIMFILSEADYIGYSELSIIYSEYGNTIPRRTNYKDLQLNLQIPLTLEVHESSCGLLTDLTNALHYNISGIQH